MVLSDELYQLLLDFHHNTNKKTDNDKVEALLSYIRNPILTNIAQLNRLNIQDKSYRSHLLQKYPQLQNLDLEELSQNTLYKIILTTDTQKQFPYVNVLENNEFVQNSFSMTVNIGQNRTRIKEYLKQQLKNAKELYIYDCYFAKNWDLTKELFSYLNSSNVYIHLPKNIFDKKVKSNTPNQNGKKLNLVIKTLCTNFQVVKEQSHQYFANKKHDRFIIIDDEIELIFTSGIDNFFNPNINECTLIIRRL